MRITLCARSQLLQEASYGIFRIETIVVPFAGILVDLSRISEIKPDDIIMSNGPIVVAAPDDAKLLQHQVIDFDYTSGTFTLSQRGKE
jgi:hypothetical protein